MYKIFDLKMLEPLISIIIPTYNNEITIKETIESLIEQTYANWECIVVDDGSDCRTEKIIITYLNSYSNINYFKRKRIPKGVSTCWNIGIEKAKGDFIIIFLDADDLLDRDCLQNRINYSEQHPTNDLWIFKMQEFVGNI